jgi:hypothetical protein
MRTPSVGVFHFRLDLREFDRPAMGKPEEADRDAIVATMNPRENGASGPNRSIVCGRSSDVVE